MYTYTLQHNISVKKIKQQLQKEIINCIPYLLLFLPLIFKFNYESYCRANFIFFEKICTI